MGKHMFYVKISHKKNPKERLITKNNV